MDEVEIHNRFTYHAPTPEKVKMHERIRELMITQAQVLNHVLPEGRDKALAFTKLEEVMFHANAAIARN